MVENAITFDERSKATIADEMRDLTDIDNPNSVSQMKSWLSDQWIEVESLGKKAIAEMIKDAPEDLAQILSLCQQLTKALSKNIRQCKMLPALITLLEACSSSTVPIVPVVGLAA